MHIERITHLINAMHEPRFAEAVDKVVQQKLGEGAVDAVTGIAEIALEAGQAPDHDGCRALGGELQFAVWLKGGRGFEANSESVHGRSHFSGPAATARNIYFGRATFWQSDRQAESQLPTPGACLPQTGRRQPVVGFNIWIFKFFIRAPFIVI